VTDYAIVVTKLTDFERRMGPKEPISATAYRTKELKVKDTGDLGDSGKEEPLMRCYKYGGIRHKRSECLTKRPIRGRARESVIGLQWPQELKEPQNEEALTAW
jgi:hypothetical protein